MFPWLFTSRNSFAHAARVYAHASALDSEKTIAELRNAITRLERRVQELSVQQAAIMNLVQSRTDISSAELQHAVQAAVDETVLSETPLASAVTGAVRTCPACGRTRSIHAKHCIYCGAQPSEPA